MFVKFDSFKLFIFAMVSSLTLLHAQEEEFATENNIYHPISCCMGQAYLRADLLYLKPTQGGLARPRCVSLDDPSSSDSSIIPKRLGNRCKSPSFHWDLGYRVAVGCNFNSCPWILEFAYTRYDSGKSPKKHSLSSMSSNFTRPSSNWKLFLEYGDALVGYQFECSPCVTLKFFGGLRGAKIDQDYGDVCLDRFFTILSASNDTVIDSHITNRRFKQQFYGIGPLFGAEGFWDIGWGLNLYLNGDAGTLYGHYNVNSRVNDFFASQHVTCGAKGRQDYNQFFLDAGIGLRWKYCICSDLLLTLQLGLEHHQYFNHYHNGSGGDLSLQGGNFAVALEY